MYCCYGDSTKGQGRSTDFQAGRFNTAKTRLENKKWFCAKKSKDVKRALPSPSMAVKGEESNTSKETVFFFFSTGNSQYTKEQESEKK